MKRTLRQRLFHTSDSATWSTEQWRAHLLQEARTGRERDEINAIFSRS